MDNPIVCLVLTTGGFVEVGDMINNQEVKSIEPTYARGTGFYSLFGFELRNNKQKTIRFYPIHTVLCVDYGSNL